jgi:hypothetical protein
VQLVEFILAMTQVLLVLAELGDGLAASGSGLGVWVQGQTFGVRGIWFRFRV